MPARFAKVTKGLYRGGCPSVQDLVVFKDSGITKIVSLDEECGNNINDACQELGLEHVIWGLGDGNDPKVSALKKIVPTLTHGGPTYIHCFHGKDRTGMVVAMYRIYSGWPVESALEEAAIFGMGQHLSPAVTRSYYDAVKRFAEDLAQDESNVIDAVTLTRETNPFAPQNPAINDMTFNRPVNIGLPPSADIEFSQLSRIAKIAALGKKSGIRIYNKCTSSEVLKPRFWWASPEDAKKNTFNTSGKMFSAKLSSSANFESINKKVTKSLIQDILSKDIDVAILNNTQYFVIDPNSLIDIQEEDDVNDIVEVGLRDNSNDYTFAYPGSGSGVGCGMPDSASGVVQLPYSGHGMV